MDTKKWWQDKKAPHEGITDVLHQLEGQLTERDERWKRYLRWYHNAQVEGWAPGQGLSEAGTWRSGLPRGKRLSLNPVENALSTLASRIASNKIRARVLTSTTSPDKWSLKKTAQKLERFIIGEWARGRVYEQAPRVFLDAGITGLGAIKVFSAHGRITYERTFPGELVVDEAGCLTSGHPRSLYQIKWVPAEVLAARFPGRKHRQAIGLAVGRGGTLSSHNPSQVVVTDLVQVIEAWHLPSSEAAGDGRHVICLADHTLMAEQWEAMRFPFAFFRWSPVVLGFFPQGLVERGEPTQDELNKLVGRIQEAHHLYATAQTYVSAGTVDKGKLTNIPGAVVEYRGQVPPSVQMPPSVSSEVYRWVDSLYARTIEGLGLNQLSMSGAKPPGIESGIAIRELQDSQSGRFALLSQAWEQMFVDLAELTINTAKGIEGYTGRHITAEGCEDIPWSDVDLDRQAYELQVFPSSYLPQTPAGRLATVQDLLQAGFVDAKTAVSLLNFPDLDSFTSLSTAALEDVDRQIEAMLADGTEEHPEPYQDLELALSRTTSALLRARQEGAPAPRMRLLLNYIEEAQDLLQPPAPPAGPPIPGPEGLPPEAMAPMMGPEGLPTPIPGPQDEDLPLATPEELLE